MLDRIGEVSITYTLEENQKTEKNISCMGRNTQEPSSTEPFISIEKPLLDYCLEQRPIYTKLIMNLDLDTIEIFNEALSSTKERTHLKRHTERRYFSHLDKKVKRLRSECRKVYLEEYEYNKRPKTCTVGEMRTPAKNMVKELLKDQLPKIFSHFRHTNLDQVREKLTPLLNIVNNKATLG